MMAEVWFTSDHDPGRPERRKRHVGERFGLLVLVEPVFDGNRATRWRCRCDCGGVVVVRTHNLGRMTRSCGCLRREVCRERERAKGHPTHGRVLSYYRRNAMLRHLSWDLTTTEFTALIEADCWYCGAAPQERTLAGKTIVYNGIDRLDNAEGYRADNVVSCCSWCNQAKSTMNLDDFLAWVRRVALRHEILL